MKKTIVLLVINAIIIRLISKELEIISITILHMALGITLAHIALTITKLIMNKRKIE
jgi:hypothetical protein